MSHADPSKLTPECLGGRGGVGVSSSSIVEKQWRSSGKAVGGDAVGGSGVKAQTFASRDGCYRERKDSSSAS